MKGQTESAGSAEVSAHLHLATHEGGGGLGASRTGGDGRGPLVDGGVQAVLGDAVAGHHHVALHEVGGAVLQHVTHGQLLQVGGVDGGTQGRGLAEGSLVNELHTAGNTERT